ncbi:hypothetical protein R3P38DRAFT_2804237 [Favolaschia claudopus]|uniref:Uncharacterized protein n=1 Tax=Favolaschia claudopus TaxID=2862362 RepID=A0AAV9ZQK5_9AGAR
MIMMDTAAYVKCEAYLNDMCLFLDRKGPHPGVPPPFYQTDFKAKVRYAPVPSDYPRTEREWFQGQTSADSNENWNCLGRSGVDMGVHMSNDAFGQIVNLSTIAATALADKMALTMGGFQPIQPSFRSPVHFPYLPVSPFGGHVVKRPLQARIGKGKGKLPVKRAPPKGYKKQHHRGRRGKKGVKGVAGASVAAVGVVVDDGDVTVIGEGSGSVDAVAPQDLFATFTNDVEMEDGEMELAALVADEPVATGWDGGEPVSSM